MKPIYYIWMFLSILGMGKLEAQRINKELFLEEALQRALSQNSTIKISALEEDIAQAQFKESHASFLPQVNFSYTSTLTNNPLMVFGNKLVQSNVGMADFNPDLLNNPSDYQNHNAMINVLQPLINVDVLYQRRAAGIQKEVYHHRTARTQEYITFEIKKTYHQLVLEYEVVEVLSQALEMAKNANEKVSNFYAQGLVKKTDYLNAQVYQASLESQLVDERSNIETLSDQLSILMGSDQGVTYSVKKEEIKQVSTPEASSFNENRSDFLAYKKSLASYDKMVNGAKSSFLPKLNAFGNYQYNNKTFGFGANSYFVGLQMSWDIFKGSSDIYKISTQKYRRAKLEEEFTKEKEQTKLEIEKTNRSIGVIQSRINQLKLSEEQANESLTLTKDRYDLGLLSTTDLLMAQTQLSQQRLMLSKAYFEYLVNQSYLMFLTQSSN